MTGCVLGVVLGNLLALPLLAQTANAFGVGALGVPLWVDAAVLLGMLAVVGIAALVPSLRAGRLSAVQAIALGRAPATGRGYAAHRLLARLRLPRPVSIGLAAPFARPARTAMTLASVLLGATAVTFAVGLSSSLSDVVNGLSHARAQPVQVSPGSPNAFSLTAAQQHAVEAALRAQPGTARYTAETDQVVSVAGLRRAGPGDRVQRRLGLGWLRPDQRALVHRPRPGGRAHRLPDRLGHESRRHGHHDRGRPSGDGPDRRAGLRYPGPGRRHDHERADAGPAQPRAGPALPVRHRPAARHLGPGLRVGAERHGSAGRTRSGCPAAARRSST